MVRRTFFSFHYVDVWRAWNVRNSWVVKDDEQIDRGFFDSSVFEASKRESEDTLNAFLRDSLSNTSVTCVLAGASTWTRRWVRYEIARSVLRGNGLLNVHIYGLKNDAQQTAAKGSNPLDALGLYKYENGIFFAEWRDDKWIKYKDYTLAIVEKDLWFDAPTSTSVVQLSRYCMSYDFTLQDGRKNIGGWIEMAAGMAGR